MITIEGDLYQKKSFNFLRKINKYKIHYYQLFIQFQKFYIIH